MGQKYFHFVLKLVVTLHSVVNLNVLELKLRKRHKSRQALFRHGAMTLIANEDITLQIGRRTALNYEYETWLSLVRVNIGRRRSPKPPARHSLDFFSHLST